jgi:hypothetical protein
MSRYRTTSGEWAKEKNNSIKLLTGPLPIEYVILLKRHVTWVGTKTSRWDDPIIADMQ